ncbi:unnamed protein product [Brassicogethes aeneus]|uniref:Uncharacterized protein n=1 Tax=Brassicogethes aeneus TaxID=1431903 RepID=A0A9P0FNP7_BRAAE|nr:unnamed protein product [Brassicogethes aeneus]
MGVFGVQGAENSLVLDLTWDESSSTSIEAERTSRTGKRPREETTPADTNSAKKTNRHLTRKAGEVLDKIMSGIKQLGKLVEGCTNTKREIRDMALGLRSLASQLAAQDIKGLLDRADQAAKSPPAAVKIVEATDTVTESDVKECKKYDDFKRIVTRKWPQELYAVTTTTEDGPLVAGKGWDIGVCAPEGKLERGISKAFKDRYPDLTEIKGNFGYVKVTIEKMGRIAIMQEDAHKTEQDTYDALVKARSLLEQENRSKLAMSLPAGGDDARIQKMVECIFNGMQIEVRLTGTRGSLQNKDEKEWKVQKTGKTRYF